MKHQVFIERCRDSKPETAISLAESIARRYGIDPEQILSRLKEGSFRVKANLDFAGAREFMNYLEKEGALCRIVNDKGETVAQSSALIVTLRSKPMKGTATMQESAAAESELTNKNKILTMASQKVAPALALETPPPPPDMDYESGLAAAYSANAGNTQDLGALGEQSSTPGVGLRLETLDGSSEEEQAKEPSSSKADMSNAAAFLPPDMLEEKSLELDMEPEAGPALPESVARSDEKKSEHAPSASARISAAQEAQESLEEERAPAGPRVPPHKLLLTALSASERLRFAVGILLAVVLGYGVMTLVASSREASRYSPVIAELNAKYDAAKSRVAWDSLDDARATTLDTLHLRRRGIVILSLFVWLFAMGLFAFVWLRMIDWSRWEEVVSDGPVRTPAPP